MPDVPVETDDDLLTPIRDACRVCGLPEADHRVRWVDGGPRHDFQPPHRAPRPERITGCHIETTWTCTQCGSDCDVWGEADGWMQCTTCWTHSYLVPFLTEEPVRRSTDPSPDHANRSEGGN